ncbi:hypothetical protein ACEWY4_006009 [Coilia grayii]|uniref:HAT C-terminal dimerisation domain-containing protein n=1 Tax=Coilia grayii TaxID=363190 RepID=A0ABD1KC91_9TELE
MLIQNVATRWNSTFYMMKSLLENKHALAVFATEHALPARASLTVHQWGLTEKLVTLLAPFEELTKQISSHSSSTADVIPSVVALKRLLSKETEADSGVRTTKSALLEAVHGYLSEPPIPRDQDPLHYWASNHARYPDLALAARKYLSAPPTSVDSKRLFSAASDVVDDKRNRILSDVLIPTRVMESQTAESHTEFASSLQAKLEVAFVDSGDVPGLTYRITNFFDPDEQQQCRTLAKVTCWLLLRGLVLRRLLCHLALHNVCFPHNRIKDHLPPLDMSHTWCFPHNRIKDHLPPLDMSHTWFDSSLQQAAGQLHHQPQ